MNVQIPAKSAAYLEDKDFTKFMAEVTPSGQITQVMGLVEIIQLLWAIFQLLKELGFFKRWFAMREVKRLMALDPQKYSREALLHTYLLEMQKAR